MTPATRLTAADVLSIVDIRTKIVSLSSLAIGTAHAVALRHEFAPAVFALMLAATLCVDMGTTGFNSYYDFVHGVDTRDTDVERSKALVQRGIAPRAAFAIAWAMFGLAAVFGLALGALVGWRVVAVGAACMAVGILYSAGPAAIARYPVGEPFAGGLLGLVLIALSAFVQGVAPDAGVLWLGLPSSVLIATILSVNNACDREGDARAGRRTLGIVLGATGAARAIVVQCAATLALALALIPLRVVPIAAVVPLAIAGAFGARTLAAMHRRGYSHATKGAAMGGISAIFVAYTLAALAGIAMRARGWP
jgi:1,4-dihydroxy-2-naphthoate octaprenyltransferase